VRGVNWLGDAVMTTPALQRLREALPETHIALLTRAKLADLWHGHPALNEVIRIEPGESMPALARRLRAGRFDTALVLPNSPRSALEMWLAGIPRRIGYDRPWRNLFLTDVIPTWPGHVKMRKPTARQIRLLVDDPHAHTPFRPPLESHQMHEYLHLAGALGADTEPVPPSLAVSESEMAQAGEKFQVSPDAVWLGLNAGAEYGPAKRWPVERFIEAARAIREKTGCRCLVFGGPADTALADRIAGALGESSVTVRNVAGRTSLRELLALLARCRALLTNDTGPMHLAAALGVPVVVPFGSTSPELTGPGLPGDPRHRLIRANAPCAPCFLRECPIDFRCMNGISVEQVVQAAVETLTQENRSGS